MWGVQSDFALSGWAQFLESGEGCSRNLNDSTAVTELFMMVSGGGSPEYHLHCFQRVKLQVVKTVPDSQLLNLLSVSRLVTVLNEADQCGVICKLQELNGGIFRCAVVGVEGEEQWGENTALRSSSADRAVAGDRWRWGRRAVSVYSEGCPGWWC